MNMNKTFLTESYSGLMAGPRVEARSFDEAELKCPENFKVIGEFICEIDAPEFDNFNLN